jgi:hypothetical protein
VPLPAAVAENVDRPHLLADTVVAVVAAPDIEAAKLLALVRKKSRRLSAG